MTPKNTVAIKNMLYGISLDVCSKTLDQDIQDIQPFKELNECILRTVKNPLVSCKTKIHYKAK